VFDSSLTIDQYLFRANKSAENTASTPSKTPVALTQSLSALRLTHARLLEDHGATKALLRQREAEITAFEQRESEAQHTADSLRAEVRGLREKVERSERTTALAEREVGFLQALVVCLSSSCHVHSFC
jgi:mitotic spindle assembly checkpoint protein MAD1